MKFNLAALLGVLLAAFMGWFLGYIKVPYIKFAYTFWLGFFAGLVFIAFIFILIYYWRNKTLSPLFTLFRQSNVEPTDHGFKYDKISLLVFSICFLLVVSIGYTINLNKEKKLFLLNTEIEELKSSANREDQRIKLDLLLNMMNALDSIKESTRDSSELQSRMNRILALSSGFKVQKEWDPERQSYRELSSMRGMLLLAFLNSSLDSASFQMIKDLISFSYADLRNADLKGIDLSGIDLSYANLERANLEGSKLDYAKLQGANLVGVNLNKTSLMQTNFMSAKLNWAQINEAKMEYARLDSADLSNASVCKSYLKYATYIHTVMPYAQMQESNLSNGFFISTDLRYANLSKSDLRGPDFRGAKLSGIILNGSIIQEDWMDVVNKNINEGVQEIINNYHIVRDSTMKIDSIIYRFESKHF